jgi:MerR family transcriptional regulator/heat shock protein HspR
MTKTLFENKDKVYTINEVADIALIHPQTLRNWERNELLTPQRISGNQRVYTRKDLETIERIVELKEKGWNIQAIKDYFLEKDQQ